jgi:hypothetical protein
LLHRMQKLSFRRCAFPSVLSLSLHRLPLKQRRAHRQSASPAAARVVRPNGYGSNSDKKIASSHLHSHSGTATVSV